MEILSLHNAQRSLLRLAPDGIEVQICASQRFRLVRREIDASEGMRRF